MTKEDHKEQLSVLKEADFIIIYNRGGEQFLKKKVACRILYKGVGKWRISLYSHGNISIATMYRRHQNENIFTFL